MALMLATVKEALESQAIRARNPCDCKHGWGKGKTLAQPLTADL